MATAAKRQVSVRTPVGNVTSAIARNEPEDGKKANDKVKPDPSRKGSTMPAQKDEPKKKYQPSLPETPEDRYKDRYGIISMRMLPRAPRDQHLADLINTLQRYLTETAVERLFINYLEVLLARPQLPYNPYPGFVRRLRQHAEGRLINMKKPHEILSLLDQPFMPTRIDYLYKNRDCDFLWGLPSVLACCDKNTLKQYEWLVKDLVPRPETMRLTNKEFSIQAIVALVGLAVFHGTFVDMVPVIQVRVEYFVVGPTEVEAVDIFLNAMIADLNNVPKQTQHTVMGVTVSRNPEAEPLSSKGKFWSMEDISARGQEFWQEALATTMGKKFITAEMIFKTDLYMGVFKRGQKLYSFNFRQQTKRATEDESGVSSYSELTEVSLHDGIFFDRGHAEAYITMFTPRLELIDKDKRHHYERPENKLDKHSVLHRYKMPGPAAAQRPALSRAGDFPTQQDDAGPEEPELRRGEKVRVDGFQLILPRNWAPDSSVVVDAIRSAWQRKVSKLHPVADIFEAMPYLIGLMLLDRSAYDEEALVQSFKIFRSSAAQLWALMKRNRFIRELIDHFEMAEESKIVQHEFKNYRSGIKELLDSDLRECSSEMVTASRAIQHRMSEMSITPAGQGSNIPLTPKSSLDLRFINHYCRPIFYQFVEDVRPECPKVFEFIAKIRDTFPNEGPTDKVLIGTADFFYGYEDERLMKQERQVIDVQMCVERETAPSAVVIEAVIMKYLLDTHVDETWSNFLLELVMKTHFPPNPFPRLISTLRQSAVKMAYWFDPDAVLVQRLYHGSPRLVDPMNFIFQMPGCDAHGFRSALVALDTAAFFRMSSFLLDLQNTKFTQKRFTYRAAVCMAVVGHIPYYGRLDPYLRNVELVDHVYIKGPSNCSIDGLSFFANIVRAHILELHGRKDSGYVILGVFLGGTERRWTLEEIASRSRNFEVDVESVTAKKQPVYLKLFATLDWRYVTIMKHFRYHYVTYDEMENEEFFEPNPAEIYLSIFFDKAKAAFHYQQGGNRHSQDPFNGSSVRHASRFADMAIAQLHGAQDWLGVHRWFLTKALLRQSGAHVAEAWRMLHSKAAEINYLNAINKTMQDIVYYVLERKQFRRDQAVSLGSLNEGVLSATFCGYYYKLNEVFSSTIALAPLCLPSFLRRRLNSLVSRDQSGRIVLTYEPRTIEVLEEVRQSCLSVEQALAFDLHAGCRDAQQELRAILAEVGMDRPFVLEDEEAHGMQDIARPQLVIVDHVNEWHYDLHKPTFL